MGLMLGVELVRDRQSKEPATGETADLVELCKERGLLIGKGGLAGNTLRIKPPMCLTRDDADFLVDCLDEVLTVICSRACMSLCAARVNGQGPAYSVVAPIVVPVQIPVRNSEETRPCPFMTGHALKPAFSTTFIRSGLSCCGTRSIMDLLPAGLLRYGRAARWPRNFAANKVLTLHESPRACRGPAWSAVRIRAAIAVAERRARGAAQADRGAAMLGPTSFPGPYAHVSGHRLIALIEIISPANKDRSRHVDDLVEKAVSALEARRPRPSDRPLSPGRRSVRDTWLCPPVPRTIRRAVRFAGRGALTLASYVAGPQVEIYLEHPAVGAPLAECRSSCGPIDTIVPLDRPTAAYGDMSPGAKSSNGQTEGLPLTRPHPRRIRRRRNHLPKTRRWTSHNPLPSGRSLSPVDRGIAGND